MRSRPNKGLRGHGEMCHDLDSASKGGLCKMPRAIFRRITKVLTRGDGMVPLGP
jgi:hypothetical protein